MDLKDCQRQAAPVESVVLAALGGGARCHQFVGETALRGGVGGDVGGELVRRDRIGKVDIAKRGCLESARTRTAGKRAGGKRLAEFAVLRADPVIGDGVPVERLTRLAQG